MSEWEEILTEGTRSYRVKALPKEAAGYRLDMLMENSIPGILPVSEREKNGKLALAFDISSQTSLAGYCEANRLNAGELRSLVRGIGEILLEAEDYLLEPDCFLLNPEEIYLSNRAPGTLEVRLCCMPGPQESWRRQMKDLFRYLLEKIDYREEKGVQMAYELYERMNSQEYIPYASLIECADRFWAEVPEETRGEEENLPKSDPPAANAQEAAGSFLERFGFSSLSPEVKDILTVKLPAVLGYVLPAAVGILLWYHWFGE